MAWIKRNLFFLIGSLAVLGLVAYAVLFLFAGRAANEEARAKLDEAFGKLTSLNSKKDLPGAHPGDTNVSNLELARKQTEAIRRFSRRAHDYFRPIPPIPNTPRPTSEEFTKELSRTLSELRFVATNRQGVGLPSSNYNFSFEAIARKLAFQPNSVRVLSVQLGEVKAIVDILLDAKVNALEAIQREKASVDDDSGNAPNDYHSLRSYTNDLAVVSPYQVTFRGFSGELAAVLSGFAKSSNCMIIKSLNFEPAPGAGAAGFGGMGPEGVPPSMSGYYMQQPVMPPAVQSQRAAEQFAARYGRPGPGAERFRPGPPPVAPPPVYPQPGLAPARPTSTPLVDEKPVRFVLRVDIVKLKALHGEREERGEPGGGPPPRGRRPRN